MVSYISVRSNRKMTTQQMAYNTTDIYTLDDLEKIISSSTIIGDIVIRGEHLKKLSEVEKINGFLGISDSYIESLGNLKEITGDFWTSFHTVSSPLKSLGNLEKIGGDANFRYSNLSDLGNLKYVGGKLSLRDTPIDTLGKLEYVGGDIYLPKRLKNLVDIENIHIVGRIQFWNDSNSKKEILGKSNLNLQKSKIEVPYWPHQYVYSSDVLYNSNNEQKKFYRYYKESFLNGVFIDIEGNHNYTFVLFYDLISDYHQHEDIVFLCQQFEQLETFYPKTANYTTLSIIEQFEKRGDFTNAWIFTQKREFISVQTVWEYEQKINKKLLDGNLIVKLGGYSHLTNFGQSNIEAIKPFAEKYFTQIESEKGINFFELFFDKGKFYKKIANRYSAKYYHKFYLSEAEYFHYKAIDDSQGTSYDSKSIKHVVEKAILNQLRYFLKKAEDIYRQEIGMPKIGEGWISETELYYKIKDRFTAYEVIHHACPNWLGRQHLDIYFPQINIGVEYQGLQHYEPIEYFGGSVAFAKNKERDERKLKLCQDNKCFLVYVNEKYDFGIVVAEIEENIRLSKRHRN